MADFYRIDRGYPFISYATATEAAKLFEDAQASAHADVDGDLDKGFRFWVGYNESAGRLVRARVYPVAADQVPADVRSRVKPIT